MYAEFGFDFEKMEVYRGEYWEKFKKEAHLTSNEEKAISIIIQAFSKENISFENVMPQRHSESYLSLVILESGNSNDFCRIKIGPKSIWVSLDMWNNKSAILEKDVRFDNVKNRKERHWKINLSCIEDFENVTDLIIATYQAIVSPLEFKFVPQKEPLKRHMRGQNLINKILPSDFVLFDLETTGFDAGNKIIEIAALKVRNDEIVDSFESFVNPQMHIPSKTTKINGITDKMVLEAPFLSEVLGDFVKFIGNDVLVGHNIIGYDYNILSKECLTLFNAGLTSDFVDTLELVKSVEIKGTPENNQLKTLCDFFGIKETPTHRAMQDVKANFELYKILKRLPKITNHSIKKSTDCEPLSLNLKLAFDVSDKDICLTGKFKCAVRDDIKKYLKQLGANVNSKVLLKTDYLIVGDLGSETKSKILAANDLGIAIIYERDFILPNN